MINVGHIRQRILAGIRDEGGVLAATRKALRLLANSGFRGLVYGAGYQPPLEYSQWVAEVDTLNDSYLAGLTGALNELTATPRISVLMPTYETQIDHLKAAVASVQDQIYSNWQLCIADDGSQSPQLLAYLRLLETTDARIRVTFRSENGHISACSNTALASAEGEWVVLLDHDDVLTPDALACVVLEATRYPEAMLVYSDEDKLDEKGRRARPYFKPDFNLELLRGNNYICHLAAYRRRALTALGGFREGFEGAQDHDLVLRYVETLEPEAIRHIPKVLYHWREHRGSTSTGMGVKAYALTAGQRAVQEHLDRCAVDAKVTASTRGYYTVRYTLPQPAPKVTIVIPTRDALAFLEPCLETLLEKTDYPAFDVLIVDNGSTCPDTLTYLQSIGEHPQVCVVRDERPFNYSRLNNQAVASAEGEFVVLLNNDTTVITEDWLSVMVATAATPGVGVVGARLLYPDDTVQHAGIVLGVGGSAGHAFKHASEQDLGYWFRMAVCSEFSAVTGACLLVSKALFLKLGGLDESAFPIAFNDVDFCLRVREQNLRVVVAPAARLYHHESKTRGYEDTPDKSARFARERGRLRRRWGRWLESDPAYNINLTRDHEHFALRRKFSCRAGPLEQPNLSPDQFDELSELASAPLIEQLKLMFNVANPHYARVVLLGEGMQELALRLHHLRPAADILWINESGVHQVEDAGQHCRLQDAPGLESGLHSLDAALVIEEEGSDVAASPEQWARLKGNGVIVVKEPTVSD